MDKKTLGEKTIGRKGVGRKDAPPVYIYVPRSMLHMDEVEHVCTITNISHTFFKNIIYIICSDNNT